MARRRLDAVPAWSARPLPVAIRPDPTGTGPLHGVRVMDLGAVLAAPYAGTLLAELGADVMKVEPLTGDSFRALGFQYNRGQRSLAIDLQDDRGRAAFLGLVRTTDVVIDNYRPRVLEKLRIGYGDLTAFDFAEELLLQARSLAAERGAAIAFLNIDATDRDRGRALDRLRPRDLLGIKAGQQAVSFGPSGLGRLPGNDVQPNAEAQLATQIGRPGPD